MIEGSDTERAQELWSKGLYSECLEELQDYIYSICRKHGFTTTAQDIEDLQQECNIKLMTYSLKKFDPSKCSLKGYVYMVCYNVVYTANQLTIKNPEHPLKKLSLNDYYEWDFMDYSIFGFCAEDVERMTEYISVDAHSEAIDRLRIDHFTNWLRSDGINTPGLINSQRELVIKMADFLDTDFSSKGCIKTSIANGCGVSFTAIRNLFTRLLPRYRKHINDR